MRTIRRLYESYRANYKSYLKEIALRSKRPSKEKNLDDVRGNGRDYEKIKGYPEDIEKGFGIMFGMTPEELKTYHSLRSRKSKTLHCPGGTLFERLP